MTLPRATPPWGMLGAVTLGVASSIMAATVLNVAVPAVMRHFETGQDHAQMMMSGFLAGMTLTMLLSPWLEARFGLRRSFVGALLAFILTGLVGSLASSINGLVCARMLQGAAAGVLQPLGMVVAYREFPPEWRARSMGLHTLGNTLMPAVGPVLGGLLVDHLGWRALLLATVLMAVASVPLCLRCLPSAQPLPTPPSFDLWSLLTPLRAQGFPAVLLLAFAYGLGVYGSTYVIPLFVQMVANYGAGAAGLLLLPGGIALAMSMAAAGQLGDRVPAHQLLFGGFACLALSFGLLALSDARVTPFGWLALTILLGRVGLGMAIPSLNLVALRLAGPELLSHASATISFARQLGAALGVNCIALALS